MKEYGIQNTKQRTKTMGNEERCRKAKINRNDAHIFFRFDFFFAAHVSHIQLELCSQLIYLQFRVNVRIVYKAEVEAQL